MFESGELTLEETLLALNNPKAFHEYINKEKELNMGIMTLTITNVNEEKLGKLMAFFAAQDFGKLLLSFENDKPKYRENSDKVIQKQFQEDFLDTIFKDPKSVETSNQKVDKEVNKELFLKSYEADLKEKELIDRLRKIGAFEPEIQSPEESNRMDSFLKVRELIRGLDVNTQITERINEGKAAKAERLEKAKAPVIKRLGE